MIYELKTSFRYCEILGTDWEMVDSIRALTDDEVLSIQDKLINHEERSGITWDQEEVLGNGRRCARRTFIKIPDKILEIRDTPLTKTVYIQINEVPNILRKAILDGKARYDI